MRRPRRPIFVVVVLALVALAHPTLTHTQEAQPHVVRFSPEGTVKQVRQVVVRFSHAMVALGDPRAGADLFDIACPEPGTARWIDSREWAYDFARDLPAGVRCTFQLRAGITALDRRAVAGRRDFAFSTGGPAIKASLPRAGSEGIDETQAFLLLLDAEATETTVRQHAWFEVQGIGERIAARILTGPDRDAILAARGRWLPPGPRLIVQAQRPFPQGAHVTLVWGSGIAAASGVATTEPHQLQFRVRPAFSVEFSCEREQRDAPCLPVTPMRVNFSAAVAWSRAKDVVLVGPGGRRFKAETRDENAAQHFGVSFRPPFPESAEFTVELPRELRDDANRAPVNAARYPLRVKTGAFPPLAKFPSRFGVIERADPTLPVTLRRLEPQVRTAMLAIERAQPPGFFERLGASVLRIPPSATPEILPALRRVAAAKRDRSMLAAEKSRTAARTLALPKPGGADAFEVVGIPLERPGLYLIELESPRLGASLLGKPATMYVPTAALVTNLAVHFKWGAENALAWVTTLDRARPVSGARVIVQDCAGTALWTGRTDGDGIARMPALPSADRVRRCPEQEFGDDWQQSRALMHLSGGLLVVAQTADDMTFVHSSWQDGIEPWRFGVRSWEGVDPVRAHTVLDRALFRAGDTVHMKHLLRRKVMAGFAALADGDRPTRAEARHVGSEEKYEVPLTWSGTAAESRWTIPPPARLGTWEVVLIGGPRVYHGATDAAQRVTATFRVEEFRVPLMRATLRPPSGPQIAVAEMPIDVAVAYLSGGPARQLPVTVRAQVQSRARATFDDFDAFVFANGAVKEGRSRGEVSDEDDDDAEVDAPRSRPAVHQRDQIMLDAAGAGRVTIRKLPQMAVPQDLLTEVEWRDPSGETQTAATRVPLWPAARLVGMRTDQNDFARETLGAHIAVVDLAGRPIAGATVRVDVFERKLFSTRKRLVGGFYAYDHVRETKRVGELCRGTTARNGQLMCEAPAPAKGHLVLQAVTVDDAGRVSTAHRDVWVIGDDEAWWFDVRDSDRMDVLPDRRRYEPGDRARLQVRMPFAEATALVTTEREGVLDAFVTSLRGREPVVELPLPGIYAPNVFVSVLALRGRVADVKPTALVDLGRPAFKLGMTEIRVGWSAHELRVAVEPEKATYRVRDRARVRVTARTPTGAAPPAGTEIALAAVDEGLLDLAPNRSWDALDAMMRPRGQSTTTSTMQMQVIGKRHFGKKALPQGGAGGRQLTRELFDTLLTWQGRIALNDRGEAVVEIPLNDSLTAFRIVAVATGGVDRFGTGAATIRTTQDLMVLPGIPPLVRGGDRFDAEVTLRNASARAMELTATAAGEGLAPLAPQTLRLEPGQSRVVTWPVLAPLDRERLAWLIDAREASGAVDQVRVAQRVAPPLPVRTQQATLIQAAPGASVRQPVERPRDAVVGLGGVHVTLAPTLLRAATPVRDFMRAYPYRCLEQDVSRAVALRDPAMWREIVERLPAHVDGDGLLKFFPRMTYGSDHLTSYVLAIAHEAGYAIPDELRGRIQTGLRRFLEGRLSRPTPLPSPDLTLRKLAALEALSRHGAATVALAGTIVVEPNLWPTSGVLDWWNVVRRVPGVPARETRLREAEGIVRARLSVSGTTLTFSTESTDRLWWLMVSGDVNAVRTILTLLEAQVWRDEIPRLMRGALSRQKFGAWDLTLANAWGVLALEKFARVYESEAVTGISTLAIGGASEQVEWSAKPTGVSTLLAWTAQREDVRVDHAGGGRPWVTIETRAAIPLTAPFAAGYRVTRTLVPVERQKPDRWSRGDIVRVRLEVDAQSDMTWVVVNDPLPGGASHVGRGIVLTGQAGSGRAWPAYEERAFDSFRAYYQWVPKGTFTVEYTMRLEHAGRFGLPPTRVEALYAPEIFGERPNDALEIAP